MHGRGVYPAAVTPLTEDLEVDREALARLLAHFEAEGCLGVVLGGTNGEGPSLSAFQKRDMLRDASTVAGKLDLILGIATPSLDEAKWLAAQAGKCGATACLVMPPSYFRGVDDDARRDWYRALLDSAPAPVLVYNFPRMTGLTLSAEFMASLAGHPAFLGLKDSSGDRENLAAYRRALPNDKLLYVGDETLLPEALAAGWTGTISGAANALAAWLVRIVAEWPSEDADTKFALIEPVLRDLRAGPQPALYKALLVRMGVLPSAGMMPPLREAPPDRVEAALGVLDARLGVKPARRSGNSPESSSRA